MNKNRFPLMWLAMAGLSLPAGAAVIHVTPGLNNVPIQQVVYSVGGNDVVQTTPAAGVSVVGDSEVIVKSVRVNYGNLIDLQYVNNFGAEVRNLNTELASISGIGVFDNGVVTASNMDLAAFGTAVAASTTNSNLRNFIYYDYLSPGPPTLGVPDFDLLFLKAMMPDDFILVSERFGNTFFEITPLKADGTPYDGANILRFGGDGGGAYSVYDWNSGYAAATNQPGQAQAFSVASVSKFFEGTSVTPGPVYGFRIDNDGEADIKFFVISDKPFAENPENPQLVPEPSAFLFAGVAGLALALRRRRAAAGGV